MGAGREEFITETGERGEREEATRIKRRRGYRKENDIEEEEEERKVKLS